MSPEGGGQPSNPPRLRGRGALRAPPRLSQQLSPGGRSRARLLRSPTWPGAEGEGSSALTQGTGLPPPGLEYGRLGRWCPGRQRLLLPCCSLMPPSCATGCCGAPALFLEAVRMSPWQAFVGHGTSPRAVCPPAVPQPLGVRVLQKCVADTPCTAPKEFPWAQGCAQPDSALQNTVTPLQSSFWGRRAVHSHTQTQT